MTVSPTLTSSGTRLPSSKRPGPTAMPSPGLTTIRSSSGCRLTLIHSSLCGVPRRRRTSGVAGSRVSPPSTLPVGSAHEWARYDAAPDASTRLMRVLVAERLLAAHVRPLASAAAAALRAALGAPGDARGDRQVGVGA